MLFFYALTHDRVSQTRSLVASLWRFLPRFFRAGLIVDLHCLSVAELTTTAAAIRPIAKASEGEERNFFCRVMSDPLLEWWGHHKCMKDFQACLIHLRAALNTQAIIKPLYLNSCRLKQLKAVKEWDWRWQAAKPAMYRTGGVPTMRAGGGAGGVLLCFSVSGR